MARKNATTLPADVQEVLVDDPGMLREILFSALQDILETEMTEHVGAERHERTDARTGQRNGYKPRTLMTRVGTMTLMVPQDRDGSFSTKLFARYQRVEKALVLALMEMYIVGVSTRKVARVTEELCGTTFSKSTVSALCGRLDAELTAWRTRCLSEHTWPYLFVDARYEKVRRGGRVVSQGVLIAYGVRDDGFREDRGRGVRRNRERSHLPRTVRGPEGPWPVGSRTRDQRRTSRAEGGDRPPLPGSELAAMPSTFRSRRAQDGRVQAPQAARRRPEGNLGRHLDDDGSGRRFKCRRRVARHAPPRSPMPSTTASRSAWRCCTSRPHIACSCGRTTRWSASNKRSSAGHASCASSRMRRAACGL